MKGAVIDGNGRFSGLIWLIGRPCNRVFVQNQLVIHAELAFGHPTEQKHKHGDMTWRNSYLRYDFIITLPATCEDKTWPCGDMSKLTDSRTSRKSSFRRYFIPSRRHPICPVTCDVICVCSSFVCVLIPCCVMKVLSAPTYVSKIYTGSHNRI